jgi:hypothetical protein
MFVILYGKKKSYIYMEMDSENAFLADKFRIDKSKIRQIFVDETLVKIDGLEYWLYMDRL